MIFVAATAVVGVMAVKFVKKSSKRYIVAGKSLPLFFIGTMLVSESVDGNASLGNVSLTFQNGFWSGGAIPLGLTICLVLTGVFFGRIFNRMNMITLADFYFRRYGNVSEVMSGVLMSISFIILVAGNLAASGYILSVVLNIPLIFGMLITTAVVLLYTYFGGLFSCAYTDIFHIYLALIGFWLGFIYFIGPWSPIPGGLETIVANVPPNFMNLSGLTDISSGALINWAAILSLGLGDIVALDFMERVFGADGGRTAQKSCILGSRVNAVSIDSPYYDRYNWTYPGTKNCRSFHIVSHYRRRTFTFRHRSSDVSKYCKLWYVYCQWRYASHCKRTVKKYDTK